MRDQFQSGAWRKTAFKYDLSLLSPESFRVMSEELFKAVMFYVIMDYGERSINVSRDGPHGQWTQEAATQIVMQLWRGLGHVRAARGMALP